MKRIILSAMVLAFAVAVQAGDDKTSQDTNKEKPACCASKVKVSTEAKDEGCPFAKASCCKKTQVKLEAPVKQTALLSPKAAADAVK